MRPCPACFFLASVLTLNSLPGCRQEDETSDLLLAVASQVSAGEKVAGQGCGWLWLCPRKPELSPASPLLLIILLELPWVKVQMGIYLVTA